MFYLLTLFQNCTESEKSKTTELGNTNENPQILSAVASAIQHCVDKKTMNSKKFKKRLDDLYNDAIKPTSMYWKRSSKINEITI